jgi:uncharacterized FAD-dependent dehydrogenase
MNNDLAFTQVDTLGSLLAQIADLTKQADAIKDSIKDTASAGGAKVVEGAVFKATYIESNRSSTDWLAMVATKLGVEADWKKVAVKVGYEEDDLPKAIADNTKVTAVFTVKVTSR